MCHTLARHHLPRPAMSNPTAETDTRFWTITCCRHGGWAVVDIRDDHIVRRFPTPEVARAWMDAIVRGEGW